MKRARKLRTIGRHIVSDPKICHGRPTFRGTRVLVADVLAQVAEGLDWESIIDDWNDSISKEAIAEAVQLANQALQRHVDELAAEPLRVNILDENIPAHQRQLLEHRRVPVRQIGFNVGRKGMHDDEVITLLLSHRRSTFFTRDGGFYERDLCHRRYCVAYLAVDRNEVAFFIRRFLRHAATGTFAKRLGAVIRVSRRGLSIWRIHGARPVTLRWNDSQ